MFEFEYNPKWERNIRSVILLSPIFIGKMQDNTVAIEMMTNYPQPNKWSLEKGSMVGRQNATLNETWIDENEDHSEGFQQRK